MLNLIIFSAAIVGLAFLGLSVRIFFHKSHSFPDGDIGTSKAMRERGITCPRVEDAKIHAKSKCAACLARED